MFACRRSSFADFNNTGKRLVNTFFIDTPRVVNNNDKSGGVLEVVQILQGELVKMTKSIIKKNSKIVVASYSKDDAGQMIKKKNYFM